MVSSLQFNLPVGLPLVTAAMALGLAWTPQAQALNLTSTLKQNAPYSSWTQGSRLCNAAGAGIVSATSPATPLYTDCIGSFDTRSTGNDVLGNGRGPLANALGTGIFGGITNWKFAGKSDASGALASGDTGSFTNLGFKWTESSEGKGKWMFSNIPTQFNADLVISLKTATFWSAYYIKKGTIANFNNAEFDWNTLGVDLAGNRRNGKALSHASVYYANFKEPPKRVPEPMGFWGLGLVTLGLGYWGRKSGNMD
jgi:hypothetical protein